MVFEIIAGKLAELAGNALTKPRYSRAQMLVNSGSPNFDFTAPIILAGAILWVENSIQWPRSRLYQYLDSIEVINNSAVTIELLLGSYDNPYTIPAYMIKPSSRTPFRRFGLHNTDALIDTVAGDILVHARRLPPDVQEVQNTVR